MKRGTAEMLADPLLLYRKNFFGTVGDWWSKVWIHEANAGQIFDNPCHFLKFWTIKNPVKSRNWQDLYNIWNMKKCRQWDLNPHVVAYNRFWVCLVCHSDTSAYDYISITHFFTFVKCFFQSFSIFFDYSLVWFFELLFAKDKKPLAKHKR